MEYDVEKVMVTNERQSAMITRQRQQLEQQDATIRALRRTEMSKLKVGDRVTADMGAGQQGGKIVGRWALGFMVLFDVAPPREYNMGENPAAMLPSFLEAQSE